MTPLGNFQIRKAVPEDAVILCSAEQEIAQTPGQLVSRPEELSVEKFEAKIRLLENNPRGIYLVAEREGQLLGHALLDPLPLLAVQHVVHLTIAVHPGHQGQGIGEALLSDLIKWARGAPLVEKIELHVRSGNARAIALYQKLGFIEEGRWRKRVKIAQAQYFDDVLMGLFVD